MRWKEINEAPLADYGTYGDLSKEGSFRDTDLKAITNPKWVEKVGRYLEKCPQPINLYIYNDPSDKFRDLSNIKSWSGYQPWSKIYKYIGKIPENNRDSITVILVENEGDERFPLTPWMVAHRIAHAILATDRDPHVSPSNEYYMRISNDALHNLTTPIIQLQHRKNPPSIEDRAKIFAQACKFKSAKTGNIVRPGELFVELIAQYMVQGKITFERNPIGDGTRFNEPQLTDEEKKLLDLATMFHDRYRKDPDNEADDFAQVMMRTISRGKVINPPLNPPKPHYIIEKDGVQVLATTNEQSAKQLSKEYGLPYKEVLPSKQQIAAHKRALARKDELVAMYNKFKSQGMFDPNYPQYTLTDQYFELLDRYEKLLNDAVAKILESCVGKAFVL